MAKNETNAKKSLYEPKMIEIYGKKYTVNKIARKELKKIQELDKQIKAGDLDATYKQLELFLGKQKIIDELAIDEVSDAINDIIRGIFNPTRSEKNSQRPAGEKSQ
jgi:uncharacterized protein YlzI (FlbEa/FlbD family)